MKTRIFLSLPFLLSVFCSASCSKENDNIVNLTFGSLFDSSLPMGANNMHLHTENISYSGLTKKIEAKHNFILLVYEYKNLAEGRPIECACWEATGNSLEAYMKKHNVLVYGIDPNDFEEIDQDGKKTNRRSFDLTITEGQETLAIFKDGKLHHQKTNGNNALSSITEVETYLSDRVHLSHMLYVSKKQLDALISSKETVTVGFLRKICGDCSYLSDYFLKEYNKKEFKTAYVIECDVEGIRLLEGELNKEKWAEFKDEYGLSNKYNSVLGYDDGYVPSFITYNWKDAFLHKAEAAVDMCVYFNDTLKIENGICYIASSYYDGKDHPFLENQKLPKNIVGREIPSENYDYMAEYDYVRWHLEQAALTHNPYVKAYLDYHLK